MSDLPRSYSGTHDPAYREAMARHEAAEAEFERGLLADEIAERLKAETSQAKRAGASTTLSPAEAAKRLGVDRPKVIAWIRSGLLRCMNLAGKASTRTRYRITREALDDFIRLREAEAAPTPRSQRAQSRPAYERII